MWYFKGFITPAECVDLLNGILTSINKEAISTAIYNLMDAKVSAKFKFCSPTRTLLDSFNSNLCGPKPGKALSSLFYGTCQRAGEYPLALQVHSGIAENKYCEVL